MARSILLAVVLAVMGGGGADALTLKSTAAANVTPWGRFNISPIPVGKGAVTVEIAQVKTVGGVRPESFWLADKPEIFWVAEKQSKTASGNSLIQWADSRTCPALASSMDKLAASGPVGASSDGASIPLGDFDAMSPCWLDQPPV